MPQDGAERHAFGIVVVAGFLLRTGRRVHGDPVAAEEELSSTVRDRWSAVAGIAVGNHDRLDGSAAPTRRIRREAPNRGIGAMVGGRSFSEKPELAAGWAPTPPPRTTGKRRRRRKPRRRRWPRGTDRANREEDVY